MAKSKAARRGRARGAAKKGASKAGRGRRSAKTAQKRRKSSASAAKRATASAKKAARKGGAARKAKAKKVARKATPRSSAKRPAAPPSPAARRAATAAKAATARARRTPNLNRTRRTVDEREMVPTPPSSLDMDRSASAARSGRAELASSLREHTSTSPAMTAGDVDADWESAETVGDEAPGGDNPTPDQDVVDDIGHALGIEYDDDEELKGGDELIERDKKRWELDPASSDDFDER